MMRASHSSYMSLSGGWRASMSLKSAGMNLVMRRRARLPLISASCGVAPERNGERNLLDRAHAVEPMRAHIARQIEKFVGGVVGRGNAGRSADAHRTRRWSTEELRLSSLSRSRPR